MRKRWSEFSRKCQHPLLLAAGTLPLTVLLLIKSCVQDTLTLTLLYFGMYVLLAWACLLVPGRVRMMLAVLGAVLFLGIAGWRMPVREEVLLLLLPVGYSMLLFVSLPIGGWRQDEELSIIWHVGCTILHLLVQLFERHLLSGVTPSMERMLSHMLMLSFLLFLLLMMLALNRASLTNAAQARVRVPVQMRRLNIVLTIGLFLLTMIIASLPAISAFLRRAWNGTLHLIVKLAGWISSLLSRSEGGSGGGGSAMVAGEIGNVEIVEPSLFQRIVEIICYLLAFVATAMLILWMTRKLWKRLRQLLGWLWQKLTLFANAASKDYEDEITDTREDAQFERSNPLKRLKQKLAYVDESKLTPSQRIRYRYMRLRQKHTEWRQSSTAREHLSSDTAQLYERARYGHQSLTEEEAQKFRENTRGV